jgi:hypothetical protein
MLSEVKNFDNDEQNVRILTKIRMDLEFSVLGLQFKISILNPEEEKLEPRITPLINIF